MANIWEKFDKTIDVEGLLKDIQDTAKNGTSFKDVPHGQYEVKIEKLELVESKAGDPMVTCWMRVLAGDYKGSLIFMNQVITRAFQVHIVNEFLRSLESGLEIEFKSYKQYGQLLLDIHEAIDGKFEYDLKYSAGQRGFNTYEIVDVYEVE